MTNERRRLIQYLFLPTFILSIAIRAWSIYFDDRIPKLKLISHLVLFCLILVCIVCIFIALKDEFDENDY